MRIVVVVLALFTSLTAKAYDFSGNELFFPVVSRVPGVNETQWRTDLVVTNRHDHLASEVSMIFLPAIGEGIQHRFTLAPRQTVTMPDVVLETFGVSERVGTIWMGAQNPAVSIAGHARIYNAGNPAGEFGQVVHALPPDKLPKTIWLSGLTGIGGNRSNAGIANPSNDEANFSISWYDKDGEQRGAVSLSVGPWKVMLINDVFSALGVAPDEGLTLRIRSSIHPLYAYGSVVRNDTGDAYTITGSGSPE